VVFFGSKEGSGFNGGEGKRREERDFDQTLCLVERRVGISKMVSRHLLIWFSRRG